MHRTTRALLAQIRLGLAAIADAYDRLLDLEVVAYACQLADRMQDGIQSVLKGTATEAHDVTALREAIAELQNLVREHQPPRTPDPRTDQIRQLARDRWLEARFDEDADIIEDTTGAHVRAWLWVSYTGTKLVEKP